MSFQELSTKVRDACYDARLKQVGEPRYPSRSELHWAMKNLPETWLKAALAELEALCLKIHRARFGPSKTEIYVLDSTEFRCDRLRAVRRVDRWILRHESLRVAYLTRQITNTVVAVEAGERATRDIDPFIANLRPGDVLLVDSEYDSEHNCRLAAELGVILIIRLKRHRKEGPRKRFRRRSYEAFDQGLYGWRKLGERPFGNAESRGQTRLHYRLPEMRVKAALLIAAGHNLGAYLATSAWCRCFLVPEAAER